METAVVWEQGQRKPWASQWSALDFLCPLAFVTQFDAMHQTNGHAREQYENGVSIGREYGSIAISVNNVWSARDASGHKVVHSYETLGLHACTADLLRGFLDSGAAITVHRLQPDGTISRTRIR